MNRGAGDRGATDDRAEWLAGEDPLAMLEFLLGSGRMSDRKLRLFATAAHRRFLNRYPTDLYRDEIVSAERRADGLMSAGEIEAARNAAENSARSYVDPGSGPSNTAYEYMILAELFHEAADQLARRACPMVTDRTDDRTPRDVAALLTDVFGDPFRPVMFSPEWRTDTAVVLARQMYDSRDFSVMSILADALQDAGCDNEEVLGHCRGPGPHVRGCWVVDLVLGKE